jgi:hypothetical protein
MASYDDTYRLLIEVQGPQAITDAERRTQDLEDAIRNLARTAQASGWTEDLRQELRSLGSELERAKDQFQGLQRAAGRPIRLQGADRAAAKFQLGFAGANIAQDVIQGGPAAGINNLLGLASSGNVRALAGEFLAAAGGAAGLGTALAGVGVAAGAAFLVVNNGLKEAKLEWSDLGDIAQNTAIWTATTEAISGVGIALNEIGITQKSVGDAILSVAETMAGPILTGLAKAAIGWDQATDAVRRHKEEMERGLAAYDAFHEAEQRQKNVKSQDEAEAEKRAKTFRESVADTGGKGGLDSVVKKLAEQVTAKGGDDKVKRMAREKDSHGRLQPVEKEMARRQAAKMDARVLIEEAAAGDRNKQAELRRRLARLGMDTSRVDAAAGGRDLRAEKKQKEADAKKKARADAAAEAHAQAEDIRADEADTKRRQAKRKRERAHADEETVKGLQGRFNLLTAGGKDVTRAGVANELLRSGTATTAAGAAEMAPRILAGLKDKYREEIGGRARKKGLTFQQAEDDFLKEDADKKAKKTEQARHKAEQDEETKKDKAVAKAKDLLPPAEKLALKSFTDARLSGKTEQQALAATAERLKAQLMAMGQGADQATIAAKELATDAMAESRGKAIERFYGLDQAPQERRNSEVFEATGLQRQIQGAVGGGSEEARRFAEVRRTNILLEQMLKEERDRRSRMNATIA